MANNNDNMTSTQPSSNTFCQWSIVKCDDLFAASPSPRYMHAVVSHGNHMFLFGGTGANKDDRLWVFEFQEPQSKGVWSVVETFNDESKPCVRWGHSMNIVGNQLIIFGGWDNSSQFNDIYLLNLSTKTWREIFPGSNVPKHRSLHSAVTTHDGKVVIFGGAICAGGPYLYYDDVWIFDTKSEKFELMKTIGEAPAARAMHTAFLVNNHLMYIFGGWDGCEAYNDVHVLNLQTREWKKIEAQGELPPAFSVEAQNYRITGRQRPGVLVGDKIFFVGGPSKTQKSFSDDMYIFDLETSTWSRIYPSTKPPVLGFHTLCAVSDCHKAILFGGTGPGMTADAHAYVAHLDLVTLHRPAVPPSTFLQEFGALLFQDRFSDFLFHVREVQSESKVWRKIPAHKTILYARCQYFRALFDSNMKEAQDGVMAIEEASLEAFSEVLRYLYTDQANVTPSNATEIIVLANRYGLERLERTCEAVITEGLDENCVCHILMGAESANLEHLKKICKVFIVWNFREVSKTIHYQELPVELRKEIEIKYMSQSTTRTNPFKFSL